MLVTVTINGSPRLRPLHVTASGKFAVKVKGEMAYVTHVAGTKSAKLTGSACSEAHHVAKNVEAGLPAPKAREAKPDMTSPIIASLVALLGKKGVNLDEIAAILNA